MPLVIISRRLITFREPGRGEMTVLMVPGRDQIQVVKDLAGTNAGATVVPREAGAKGGGGDGLRKQVQLSRVHIGRRFIYGNLPAEISDLRQPVKVWLAEDYAPLQSQAFFFIFSNNVVIHGVREQDDEGYQNWRTAQLSLDGTDPVKSIINAISDYALANSVESLTVAVQNKLDLYEKLQQGLATYNISPVPFSKLKPQQNLKPLYKHSDFTILYLTLALFGLITLLASAGYAMLAYMQRNALQAEAAEIQNRIDQIKFNQSVGQIADPRAVLQTMSRAINQQPSAIIHAAGSTAAELGPLTMVKVMFDGNADGVPPAPAGQINVVATITKMANELLLDQEQTAENALTSRPWVREAWRGGSPGDRGDLIISLQIDGANLPTEAPAPAAEAAPDPLSVSETNTLAPQQPTPDAAPSASPTVPAVPSAPAAAASTTASVVSSSVAQPVSPATVAPVQPAAAVSPLAPQLPVVQPKPLPVSASAPAVPSQPQGEAAR